MVVLRLQRWLTLITILQYVARLQLQVQDEEEVVQWFWDASSEYVNVVVVGKGIFDHFN